MAFFLPATPPGLMILSRSNFTKNKGRDKGRLFKAGGKGKGKGKERRQGIGDIKVKGVRAGRARVRVRVRRVSGKEHSA